MHLLIKLYHFFEYCFAQFHQTKFLIYCFAIFASSIASFKLLIFLKREGHEVLPPGLRRFIFVNAGKSDSNALQIGGIPFAFISMIAISLLFSWFPYLIDYHQAMILKYASFSWVGILIYGHIDDRYEIRPIAKLSAQLFLISVFCILTSNVVFPQNTAYSFLVMLFFATAIVNGSNLIDGLDTLSYKVSSVIYLAFVILAAPVGNLPALFIAIACFCNMSGFYFFNREPSKVHLGEVGASCLGFSYIVLAVLTFDSYQKFNPTEYALSKAIFPCILPLIELSVSFFRRIFNGKSPFKGDKLHIHHILHEAKGYSASNASSIIAAVYFIFILVAFIVMEPYSSILAFLALILMSLMWYVFVGWKFWFVNKMKITIFESLLTKKEVKIISSDSLSDFSIIIRNPDKDEK